MVFSVVDVVAVLTNQPDQRGASNYWAKLKQRLKEEGANQVADKLSATEIEVLSS